MLKQQEERAVSGPVWPGVTCCRLLISPDLVVVEIGKEDPRSGNNFSPSRISGQWSNQDLDSVLRYRSPACWWKVFSWADIPILFIMRLATYLFGMFLF